MDYRRHLNRQGFSLLELLLAMTLMVSAVTATSVLLRVNYQTWLQYRSENVRHESALGVLRHVVRQTRQCQEVTAISPPASSSGFLQLRMPSGAVLGWDHQAGNVRFGEGGSTELLGNHITSFTLEGFQADGITPTAVLADIQCVRVTVGYSLPDRAASTRTVSAMAWIRAF